MGESAQPGLGFQAARLPTDLVFPTGTRGENEEGGDGFTYDRYEAIRSDSGTYLADSRVRLKSKLKAAFSHWIFYEIAYAVERVF